MSITFKWGNAFLSDNVRGYEVYRSSSDSDLYNAANKVATYPASTMSHTFAEPCHHGKIMVVGIRSIAKTGGHSDSTPYYFGRKDTDPLLFRKFVGALNGDANLPLITGKEFPLFNQIDTMLGQKCGHMADFTTALSGFNKQQGSIRHAIYKGKEYFFNFDVGNNILQLSYQIYSAAHVAAEKTVSAVYRALLEIDGNIFAHNDEQYKFHLYTNKPEQTTLFPGAYTGTEFPHISFTNSKNVVYDLVDVAGTNAYTSCRRTKIVAADGSLDTPVSAQISFNNSLKIFAYFEKM